MKIKSNFKDYYDFVGGLGDPRVVYNRVPFSTDVVVTGNLPRITYCRDIPLIKWLVVAGRLYLLDNSSGSFKLSDDWERLTKNYWNCGTFTQGEENATALRWCRELKAPVFLVDLVCNKWVVRQKIPALSELGMPSIVSAFQMYQDIAYFIGNTINTNPDIACPVVVSEKDRIVGHGFDLKTSFRGKV